MVLFVLFADSLGNGTLAPNLEWAHFSDPGLVKPFGHGLVFMHCGERVDCLLSFYMSKYRE